MAKCTAKFACISVLLGQGLTVTTVLAGMSIIVYPAQPMRRSEIDPLYTAEFVWRLKRPDSDRSHLPSHTQERAKRTTGLATNIL